LLKAAGHEASVGGESGKKGTRREADVQRWKGENRVLGKGEGEDLPVGPSLYALKEREPPTSAKTNWEKKEERIVNKKNGKEKDTHPESCP